MAIRWLTNGQQQQSHQHDVTRDLQLTPAQWRHYRGGGLRTAPGDTLQGVTPEGKKIVGIFTKNSGETRSDR